MRVQLNVRLFLDNYRFGECWEDAEDDREKKKNKRSTNLRHDHIRWREGETGVLGPHDVDHLHDRHCLRRADVPPGSSGHQGGHMGQGNVTHVHHTKLKMGHTRAKSKPVLETHFRTNSSHTERNMNERALQFKSKRCKGSLGHHSRVRVGTYPPESIFSMNPTLAESSRPDRVGPITNEGWMVTRL